MARATREHEAWGPAIATCGSLRPDDIARAAHRIEETTIGAAGSRTPVRDLRAVEHTRFDLVLSAFAFDNIPGAARRCELLRGLRRLLAEDGRIIVLGSTPEIARYTPLGRDDEPYPWLSETSIAPWMIYVAGRR